MILVSISLVTPQAAMEFGPRYATLLSASLYAGMLFGAVVLGGLADNIGRRLVWQLSIFGCSIVTTVAACSPNWAALNIFIVLIGIFTGGNRKQTAQQPFVVMITNSRLSSCHRFDYSCGGYSSTMVIHSL